MDILIVGASGSGKSKLGDLVRTTIFKLDEDSKIVTSDPDRENKSFGDGKNTYNIKIHQVGSEPKIVLTTDDLKNDVVIVLTSDSVSKWFKEMYE